MIMKKINILFASVIVSMAASCTAEKALDPVRTSFVKYDFEATAGDVITKTSLGADQKTVSWTAGDQISVFSLDADTPANNLFALKEGETAKFSGEIEEGTQNIVAVYPYAASNQLDRSTEAAVVKAVIPAAQTATKDSFSNGSALMFYSGPLDASLAFKNISAVVSFVLPEELGMVNSVKVSAANSSAIAGNVSVDMQGNVSNADATVIELAGDFEGANTYYFAMLPGQYTGGLLFEVATDGGNKFYRQNASSMVLDAGTVNKVGTLSLVMDTEMLTPAATLAHTFDTDGILTGTKVEASVAVPAEFAGLLSEVAWSAELLNASSEVVRTVEGTGLDAAQMSVANGFVYLPAGEYTLKLTNFAYKACGQKRQVAGVDSKTATVTAAAPAANTLKFKTSAVTGYTSYDVYADTDANTSGVSGAEAANALDGSTIYNFSATLDETSGISEAVKTQMVPTFQPAINGVAKTAGVVPNISTGAAELGCLVSFDGQEYFTAGNTTAPVSGLPFNVSKAKPVVGTNVQDLNAQWKGRGADNSNANYLKISCPLAGTSYALSPEMYIPQNKNIDVSVTAKFKRDNATYYLGFPTYLSGNVKLSLRGSDGSNEYVIKDEKVEKNAEPSFSDKAFECVMTPNCNCFFIENKYAASGSGVYIYYVTILYR